MNQEERRQKRQDDFKHAVVVVAVFVLILAALLAGAAAAIHKFLPKNDKAEKKPETQSTEIMEDSQTVQDQSEAAEPVVDPLVEQAAQLVSGMSLEDKVAQMFVITPEALTGYASVTAAGDTTKAAYENRPVGGLIYMADNLVSTEQTTEMLTNMQNIAMERTGLPVFLSVDEEGGTVVRVAKNEAFGVTDVGNMSDIGATGDLQKAYDAGASIGTYLKQLGFNVDYAPVADVLTNPDNTVIGTRSFGSDASVVADMVTKELEGLSSQGVFGVVKHFPGHGGTSGDSHDGAVTLDKSLEELMQTELVPFQRAVENGVSFVMVGHISVPQVVGDNTPASLSQMMVSNVLREQLGYQGIVITDAFDMASITDNYTPGEAALQSFMAGADIILMPSDLTQAYQAILNAVNSKKITQSRLDESVIRILTTKFKHGILTQEDLTVWEQPTATPSVTPAVTVSPKAKKGKKNRESAKTIKKSTKNKSKK